MPNISRTSKAGRSVDSSDLLASKKRDILLAVEKSKDAANNRKSLIKQPGFNTGIMEMVAKRGLDLYNFNTTISASIGGQLLGSIKVNGYTLGNVTSSMINDFKLAFAATYGVNPNLITISFRSGSMIIDVSVVPLSSIDLLDLDDKTFFSNIDSVMKGIQPEDVAACIATAQIPQNSINPTGTLSIDTTYTTVNTSAEVISAACEDDEYTSSVNSYFRNPFVADSVNNCMYTVIDNKVVRVTISGRIELIGTYSSIFNFGCRFIFINSTSTHLIIPYFNNFAGSGINNTIYTFKISNGELKTITLSDDDDGGTYGFDKTTNRLYYTTPNTHVNGEQLCYITIPDFTQDRTLAATFGFSSITNINDKGKIEFISSTIAFCSSIDGVAKLDLSVPSKTYIAGNIREGSLSGFWTNSNNQDWYDLLSSSSIEGGPYFDGVGVNAFFSWIGDVTFDSVNNRLLVCDMPAQRIRAISLNPSGNPSYTVTTIAGTSPIQYGLAGAPIGNYSSQVLAQLGQIGKWGYNHMPAFVKQNSTYLSSTFKYPIGCVVFNGKIYVRTLDNFPYDSIFQLPPGIKFIDYCTTRQLSNGYVTDFTGVKTF